MTEAEADAESVRRIAAYLQLTVEELLARARTADSPDPIDLAAVKQRTREEWAAPTSYQPASWREPAA